MGRAARERASSYYAWDRLGRRLRAIYDDALAGRPPGREERP